MLNGIDAEWLEPDEVKKLCPIVNISRRHALPGARGDLPAARGNRQTRLRRLGLRAPRRRGRRGHASRAARSPGSSPTATGSPACAPRCGDIAAGQVALCAAGHTSVLTDMLGIPRAAAEPSAAGAGLRTARARAPDDRDVQRRARLRLAGAQGRAGDGRRHRLVQRLRPARRLPHHRAADGRGRRALPDLRPGASAADLGRHRRRHARTPRRSSASPRIDNLYLNCGWGTGGFKATPGVGWCLADTIAHDEPHPYIAPFTLDRFVTGALVDEHGAAAVAH